MQHPDEGTIHAWLDGALSTDESAALDTHVASCSECAAAVAEARGLIAASSRIVSALDIVPGGVIPARKPAVRPWYLSTQLRAAAAVIFIAGTSFVLFRSRGDQPLSSVSQRVMMDQAAQAVAEPESDAATQQANSPEPAAATGAAANAVAAKTASPPERKAENARARTGGAGTTAAVATEAAQGAADVALPPAAPAPAPAAMTDPAPPAATISDTADFSGQSVLASPIIVTGVTTGDLSSDLRILSVDSSTSTRVTRYRIASGAELTLIDMAPVAEKAVASRRFDAARSAASSPQLRQAAPQEASGAPVQSVSWTDPRTQRTYTLSGRVSKETLEVVKSRIQQQQKD
jgi:hypothetical protein